MIAMGSGYIFWFIMSQISTPSAIGLSSTIISLTTIFSTVASIGIPLGVQRFLGKSFSDKEANTTKEFVKASIILTSIGIVSCSVIFVVLQSWLYQTFEIDLSLLIVSIFLITSTTYINLFRSIIVSTLNTRMLPIIMIIGVLVKIILAFMLVMLKFGALGIIIGFVFFPILGTILYSIMLIKLVNSDKSNEPSPLRYYKNLFVSSVANWVPTIIYTLGAHLGTLLVFGSHGSIEAGIYFIAFSLSMAVTALSSALYTIAYPALSSMKDARKRFTWRTIKFSLLFSLPLSISILFYSSEILNIFGKGYSSGSLTLDILMISIMPTAISAGIINLNYSYGNYNKVLTIGLASNVPRTILYFALVPSLEGIGAAMSYTIGSLLGFLWSLWIARKINLTIEWKQLTYLFFIPILIHSAFFLIQLNFIVEILFALVSSYLAYIGTKVLNRRDMKDLLSILPTRISLPLLKLARIVEKRNTRI